MRKIIFITIMFVSFGNKIAFGQDTTGLAYSNELGLDFTPFIKFYLSFGQNSTYYQPAYFITYRFHMKHGNIRAAIGGSYYESETPSPYQNDPGKYKNKQQSLDFRIGYERFDNLSKHWQVFYGLDFRPSFTYTKNDAPFWNAGYANGLQSSSAIYGIAPVLGLRCKVGKRLSLLTESSLQINSIQSSQFNYYRATNSTYPALPNTPKTTSKSISTNFNFPIALVVTIDI